ncbi:MAG: glycosyltransferase family 39 protein [candidate division WOR-3 bacterium]|nr:MAG: glycosyltransferase family 39 protein [candidate division WOR-3 bacterium]
MPKLWKNSILARKITNKNFLLHLLVLLFLVFSIVSLRNTSLIDWDEGVFALQGSWLATGGAEGKPFNFQTPPFFQTLVAFFFKFLSPQDFVLPLLSILFSILTIYTIFFLARILYSRREALYAVILFVTTEFFLFFSKSGLSDATFLFFFTASILFFVKGLQHNRLNFFLLAGLCTTLALYTKYSALSLLIMFSIAGILYRKEIHKTWFIFSIILPVVLFSPYVYIFIKFVKISGVSARYMGLLNINHIPFFYYLIVFAPIPLLLSIVHTICSFKKYEKWDVLIILFFCVYFIILGFYHHYFRLAYPLIPLISIIASRFINQTGKYKHYILIGSVVIALLLSLRTVCYYSLVPEKLGTFVNDYVKKEHIRYVYTLVPPNISFSIKGKIVIPSDHPWARSGKKFPHLYKNTKIIYEDNNELRSEDEVLLLHATLFDSLKQKHEPLYDRGELVTSIEFIDAPVYYKDIYNPLKDVKQIYELYVFERDAVGNKIDELWKLGFDPRVTVIRTPPE